jgi:hypothetical protein
MPNEFTSTDASLLGHTFNENWWLGLCSIDTASPKCRCNRNNPNLRVPSMTPLAQDVLVFVLLCAVCCYTSGYSKGVCVHAIRRCNSTHSVRRYVAVVCGHIMQ